MWDRYLGVIQKREDKLMALLSAPKTLSQIADAGIVYRKTGNANPASVFGEGATMKKHVERGLKKGTIHRSGDGYVRKPA